VDLAAVAMRVPDITEHAVGVSSLSLAQPLKFVERPLQQNTGLIKLVYLSWLRLRRQKRFDISQPATRSLSQA
jgi:hypothetical protein